MDTGPQDQDPRIAALGEDLVLLTVQQGSGKLTAPQVTGVGLMGAELVRLAASGRVGIDSDRIRVLDPAPTGDAEADAALASLAAQKSPPQSPPRAKAWCGRPRRGICDAYLARLADAGAITGREMTRLGFIRVRRWQVADLARAEAARARLDAVARGTGEVDLAQAALGGLAHAIGLAGRLYPGKDGRAARNRLEAVADGDVTAAPAGHAAHHAVHAASHAAVSAAVHSATHAAVSAAHSAHSAGGGHGGGGGGHH